MTVEKVCEIIDDITESIEDLNTKYTIGEITMSEYEDAIESVTSMKLVDSKLSHDKDRQLAETLISALLVSIAY